MTARIVPTKLFDVLTLAMRHVGNMASVVLLLESGADAGYVGSNPVETFLHHAQPEYYDVALASCKHMRVDIFRYGRVCGSHAQRRAWCAGPAPAAPRPLPAWGCFGCGRSCKLEACRESVVDVCWTLLHEAVLRKDQGAVQLLLDSGADVNACNERGQTPAHVAWDVQAMDILHDLEMAGTDMWVLDYKGRTVTWLAVVGAPQPHVWRPSWRAYCILSESVATAAAKRGRLGPIPTPRPRKRGGIASHRRCHGGEWRSSARRPSGSAGVARSGAPKPRRVSR